MATDEEAYPGAVFRMQYNYVHDANGGNNVKSRAERNEIYFNWIEGAYYHELELIGPDGQDESLKREDSDVVGNVIYQGFTTRNHYPIRIGGDGTGQTFGRYRFLNNTCTATLRRQPRSASSLIEASNLLTPSPPGGCTVIVLLDGTRVENGRKSRQHNWVTTGATTFRHLTNRASTNPGFVNGQPRLTPPHSPCVPVTPPPFAVRTLSPRRWQPQLRREQRSRQRFRPSARPLRPSNRAFEYDNTARRSTPFQTHTGATTRAGPHDHHSASACSPPSCAGTRARSKTASSPRTYSATSSARRRTGTRAFHLSEHATRTSASISFVGHVRAPIPDLCGGKRQRSVNPTLYPGGLLTEDPHWTPVPARHSSPLAGPTLEHAYACKSHCQLRDERAHAGRRLGFALPLPSAVRCGLTATRVKAATSRN